MYKDLVDNYMLIPIFGKILLNIFIPKFFNSGSAILFTTMFLQLILNMIPNIMKMDEQCDCINFKGVSKSFSDGTISYGFGIVGPYLLGMIPFLTTTLTLINSFPLIGDSLLWAIFYTFGYIFINMQNQDDKKNWCKPPLIFGRNMSDNLFFWIFLISSIFLNITQGYSNNIVIGPSIIKKN
jgi:hypothetical protein